MKRQFGLLVHSKEVAEMKFQIRLACWSLELDSTILSHCLPPSLGVAVKAFCDRAPAYLPVISLTLHTPLELNYPCFLNTVMPDFSYHHASVDAISSAWSTCPACQPPKFQLVL